MENNHIDTYRKELNSLSLDSQMINQITTQIIDSQTKNTCSYLKPVAAVLVILIVLAANMWPMSKRYSGFVVYAQDGTTIEMLHNEPVVIRPSDAPGMVVRGIGENFMLWDISLDYTPSKDVETRWITCESENIEFVNEVNLTKEQMDDKEWLTDNGFFVVQASVWDDSGEIDDSSIIGLQSLGHTLTHDAAGEFPLTLKLNRNVTNGRKAYLYVTVELSDGSTVQQCIEVYLLHKGINKPYDLVLQLQ